MGLVWGLICKARLSIMLIGCAATAHAWELRDMHPARVFSKHESITINEIIKVKHPAACVITQLDGPVTVQGWDKPLIEYTLVQKGTKDALENTQVTLNKQTGSCTISAKNTAKGVAQTTLHAQVPHTCAVTIQSHRGDVVTKQLARTQSIHADYGDVNVVLSTFTPESSLFVHTQHGSITVQAPKKIQAQVAASTRKGKVTSDIFVTLKPHTTLLNKEFWQRIKQEVGGMLGDGGAPITLEADYGDIKLLVKN